MVVVVGVIVGCYYSYGGKVFLGVVFNRCFLFFFVNFVLSFNRYFRRNVLFIGVLRVVVMVELVIVSEFYIKVFQIFDFFYFIFEEIFDGFIEFFLELLDFLVIFEVFLL